MKSIYVILLFGISLLIPINTGIVTTVGYINLAVVLVAILTLYDLVQIEIRHTFFIGLLQDIITLSHIGTHTFQLLITINAIIVLKSLFLTPYNQFPILWIALLVSNLSEAIVILLTGHTIDWSNLLLQWLLGCLLGSAVLLIVSFKQTQLNRLQD